jgi:hypothetical protein
LQFFPLVQSTGNLVHNEAPELHEKNVALFSHLLPLLQSFEVFIQPFVVSQSTSGKAVHS